MNPVRVTASTAALLFLVLAANASGQITGSVVGSVRDSTRAALPGVTVTLTNVDTGVTQSTVTSDTGDFRFPLVPVGRYAVSAELPGFKKAELAGMPVELGQATRVDLVLQVQGVEQTITVSGGFQLLQTESGAVHAAVRREEIVNLPLNGRNFIQLVALQPHAVPSPRTSFFRNLGGYNVVAGAPVEATAVTIDGVNIRDLNDPRITIALNPDVIEEFQQTQSSYSAAQGMGAGAQINLVTRSGTNNVRGSIFEFFRDDKFDSKNFFDVAKPPFRQNQFGFSIGGPLVRNRAFFFAGYEGLRIDKVETFRYTVPTEAQRRGDFSGGPPIYDPLNRDPVTGQRQQFPGNVIPEPRFAPEAVRALERLLPRPNQPGNANNLIGNPPDNSTNDQFSIRVDDKLSANDSLFARYIYYNYRRKTGIFTALPNFGDNFNTPSQNAAIGWVRVLGSNTTNQFRIGYHRMTQVIEDFEIDVPVNQELGITGTSDRFLGNPAISIAGFGETGGISNAPNNRSDNGYYLYDDFSHTRGRHAMSMGFSMALEQVNGGINSFARGNFAFTPRYTAQIGVSDTGSSLADFLLGYPSSSTRGLGVGFRNFRQRRVGAYFNDDWKVSDALTVNVGVRWEYLGPGFEAHDRLSGFDPATGTIILAGQNGVPRGLREQNWTDFQPRAAAAYRLPGGKTVVRGGWGLYFMPMTMFPSPFLNLLNEPFFTSQSFFGDPLVPNLTLRDAFPTGSGVPSTNLFTLNKDFKSPYLHQWNLTVQRELTQSLSVELGYLGNRGERLRNSQNINAPVSGLGPLESRRPYAAFATITSYENIGRSRYHSGHIKIDQRFSNGLGFGASYTLAKLLDRGGIVQPGDLDDTLGRDPLNPEAEYGRSFFDSRHRLVASVVWVLPLGQGHRLGSDWSGWKEQAFGNWQLNGIASYQTGLPLTPVLAFDNSNTGLFADRPDLIGDPNNGPQTTAQWFNTAAFATPPPLTYGTAGRNIIDGPPIKTVDASLFKNVTLGTGKSLQFRFEIFNLLNLENFNPPGTVFGAPNFGVISSAGEARQMQFGVKFLF